MKLARVIVILLKAIFIVPLRVLYAMLVENKHSTHKAKNKKGTIEKPRSFIKGEDFEKYVRVNLFPKEKYIMVHKTHNYEDNREDFVESSLLPDYGFRCKETNRQFFVEVKYRASTFEGKYEWCNFSQLTRYKSVNDQTTTFLLLGMGGTPNKPNNIALIPLDDVDFTGLFPSFVNKYLIDPKQAIKSNNLWKLMV